MINPEPLLKGLADAKRNADRFNMKNWCLSNGKSIYFHERVIKAAEADCNSVLCIAGWASFYIPVNEKENVFVHDAVVSYCCGGNLNSKAASDLYNVICGSNAIYPLEIMVQDITLQMVEESIHEWIVDNCGREYLNQTLKKLSRSEQ